MAASTTPTRSGSVDELFASAPPPIPSTTTIAPTIPIRVLMRHPNSLVSSLGRRGASSHLHRASGPDVREAASPALGPRASDHLGVRSDHRRATPKGRAALDGARLDFRCAVDGIEPQMCVAGERYPLGVLGRHAYSAGRPARAGSVTVRTAVVERAHARPSSRKAPA
jgi:hypothetical protein